MKKQTQILIAITVILTSLLCTVSLPFLGEKTISLGADKSLSDIEQSEAKLEWQSLENDLKSFGNFTQEDRNADGTIDRAIYQFPLETVQENVILSESLEFTRFVEDLYDRQFLFTFTNNNSSEKKFEYILTIPKEFAENIAEVTFSTPPSKIIDPDIVVRVDMALGANASEDISVMGIPQEIAGPFNKLTVEVKKQAYEKAKAKCKALPVDQRSRCYLDLVEDFQSILDKQTQKDLCNENTTGVERRMCLAIVNDNIKDCDRTSGKKEREICRAYYITHTCSREPAEKVNGCQLELALKHQCPLACEGLPEGDARNECFARVKKDRSFCDQINDAERKAKCLEDIGIKVKSTEQSANVDQLDKDKTIIEQIYMKLFPQSEAEQDCKRFVPILVGFQFDEASGKGNQLNCSYWNGLQGDDPALQFAYITITEFPNRDKAREYWEKLYGKDTSSFKSNEEANQLGLLGKYEYNDYSFFLSEKIWRWDNTRAFDVSAGKWLMTLVVEFDESNTPFDDKTHWEAVYQQTESLVADKASKFILGP
jgi:hypothetical protein